MSSKSGRTTKASAIDQYFYMLMALMFSGAAIIGFTPNSLAILNGTKSNPPFLIHLHAASMSLWLLLLSVQAALVARGSFAHHQRLGLASVFLAPVVAALMLIIAWPELTRPSEHPAFFLIQFKRVVVFISAVSLALYWRMNHPDAHKRLMFIATFAVLDAAFFRMKWLLPSFGVEPYVTAAHIYQFILIVPLITYDIVKHRRIHMVYKIYIPIIIVFEVAAAMMW